MENFSCVSLSFLPSWTGTFLISILVNQTYLCITAEESTMLFICCTPSDLVEGVPGAENDQIYIGIEAYSALK